MRSFSSLCSSLLLWSFKEIYIVCVLVAAPNRDRLTVISV